METIISEQYQHVGVFVVTGRLNAQTHGGLLEEYDRQTTKGNQNFIVDLRLATFIDSAGLSTLVQILKRVQAANGKLLVVRPRHPSAMNILSITRFDQVFFMIDSLDAALEYLVPNDQE